MRISFLSLLCFIIFSLTLSAEGTKEVAPNSIVDVNGNMTTDVAALHIGNPNFGNFASYTNSNEASRLYININDPATECIYMGFSVGHINQTSPNPSQIPFEYRIKDPNGNIVFGPITVNPGQQEINNWSEAFTGPNQLVGAGGYNATQVTSAALQSAGWTGEGDYYIEFATPNLLIDFWDFSVADCSGAIPVYKPGRVWSFNWSMFAINDFGFPNRPFNGGFFVCAPDPDNVDQAFITKIDFNGSGFRPAAFNVAFNSFGSMNTGNVIEDRKSVAGDNATQSEYAIFLNDPIDICETAEPGEITLIGVSRCSPEDYCIKFTASKEGQIDLLLDFDGMDNVFTPGTADIMITRMVSSAEAGVPSCIEWDGRDGLGNLVSDIPGATIPVVISFAQGIYHFPVFDAELMTQGFNIQNVRPSGSQPALFYDDSNIPVASGTAEPTVQLAGCTLPCHTWLNYDAAANIGYGNLNTINSWWFSQQIIRQDVFSLPAYYSCEIIGPGSICAGSSAVISWTREVVPSTEPELDIISNTWTGPGIVGSTTGATIVADQAGTYTLNTVWLSPLGDTCSATCSYNLTEDPTSFFSIDTLVAFGNSVTINDQMYSTAGQFTQTLTAANGCDSILTINVRIVQTVIHYDMEDCDAWIPTDDNAIYSEFTASYPEPLSCVQLSASNMYREIPDTNRHSCTPGVNGSIAVCISSNDACDYDAGNSKSAVLEVTLIPQGDTTINLTGLTFYEKAPTDYDWINGNSGVNNYPTLYGLRILKNGTEIYRQEDQATTTDWSQENFDFIGNQDFVVSDSTTFRFEFLGYCLIGNGEPVTAWDLDEISIMATCGFSTSRLRMISGGFQTEEGLAVEDVHVFSSNTANYQNPRSRLTDKEGEFSFPDNPIYSDYYMRANKNDDPLNGVSTLDLVLIQKHLLGIQPFTSPYKMIAADANGSNSVSALDIVELRKLLLGIYTQFPNNKSWRFADGSQRLDLDNVWDISEEKVIRNLIQDQIKENFIAIKIGDLNGTVSANSGQIRSGEKFELYYKNTFIKKGVKQRLNVYAHEVDDLHGFQLSLIGEDFEFLALHGGQVDIREEHYHIENKNQVKMSWNGSKGIDINPNEILFSIELIAKEHANLDQIKIYTCNLKSEAYIGDAYTAIDIALNSAQEFVAGASNALYQNIPNPFVDETIIRFDLEKESLASLKFYDLSGRLLLEKNQIFQAGKNEIQINQKELNVLDGMILYQISTQGFTAVKKMILK